MIIPQLKYEEGDIVLSLGPLAELTYDYSRRSLTLAERRVNFARLKRLYDEDALVLNLTLRGFIATARDALLQLVERQAAATITADFAQSVRLDVGREFSRAVEDYLVGVWRKNRDWALEELPEVTRDKVGPQLQRYDKKYASAFRPNIVGDYFRNRALMIKGLVSDDLTKQVKYQIFEHLKGGRTLTETMGNLRELFEPFVGDPTKIQPSGITGEPEDILRASRLETIIRTETTTALNQGRATVADAAGDFVVGYEFSAILDDRTCFGKGTKVKLASGKWQPIECIKPGDYVISAAGHARRVRAAWRYAASNWKRIKFSDGREIICTWTHPFWTKIEANFGWVEAHALSSGTTVATDGSTERISDDILRKVWPEVSPLQMQQAQILLDEVLHCMGKPVLSKTTATLFSMRSTSSPKKPLSKVLHGCMSLEKASCATDKPALSPLWQAIFSAQRYNKWWLLLQRCLFSCWGVGESASPYSGTLPDVRTIVPSNEKISSSNDCLFLGLPHKTYAQERAFCRTMGMLRRLRQIVISTFKAASYFNKRIVLQPQMQAETPTATLPGMWKDILGKRPTSLLLREMLSHAPSAYENRNYGGISATRTGGSLQARVCYNESIDGGLSACGLQGDIRNGRHLLASQLNQSRCEERQHSSVIGLPNDTLSLQLCYATNPRFSASVANHEVKPQPGSLITVVLNEPLSYLDWAYDLEVEGDHTYVAEGLLVHNTEVCQLADGIKFRIDDPRAVKLTPPMNFNCRSLLMFVTTNDVPIEWTDEEDLDAVVRLIAPGFK